jgi:hypothetical protein
MVGNRFGLSADQRNILYRGIQPEGVAAHRRGLFLPVPEIQGTAVAVDGYNVLLTVTAALYGRPVFLSLDGWVRDAGGHPGDSRARKDNIHQRARQMITDVLAHSGAAKVLFFLDGPVAGSRDEASRWKELFARFGVPGEIRVVRRPDEVLVSQPSVVATADGEIIDGRSDPVTDLAGEVVDRLDSVPTDLTIWVKSRRETTP